MRIAAAGAVWLLVCAASAAASPTWLGAAKLSAEGHSAEAPRVAVDAHGDALDAWALLDFIEVASRPAGSSTWGPPLVISKPLSNLPSVALDAQGDGYAAWVSQASGEWAVEVSTRAGLTGTWTAPVTVGPIGETVISDSRPQLAVDASGDAVVVWERPKAAEAVVESSVRPAGSATWGKAEVISEVA